MIEESKFSYHVHARRSQVKKVRNHQHRHQQQQQAYNNLENGVCIQIPPAIAAKNSISVPAQDRGVRASSDTLAPQSNTGPGMHQVDPSTAQSNMSGGNGGCCCC